MIIFRQVCLLYINMIMYAENVLVQRHSKPIVHFVMEAPNMEE